MDCLKKKAKASTIYVKLFIIYVNFIDIIRLLRSFYTCEIFLYESMILNICFLL